MFLFVFNINDYGYYLDLLTFFPGVLIYQTNICLFHFKENLAKDFNTERKKKWKNLFSIIYTFYSHRVGICHLNL